MRRVTNSPGSATSLAWPTKSQPWWWIRSSSRSKIAGSVYSRPDTRSSPISPRSSGSRRPTSAIDDPPSTSGTTFWATAEFLPYPQPEPSSIAWFYYHGVLRTAGPFGPALTGPVPAVSSTETPRPAPSGPAVRYPCDVMTSSPCPRPGSEHPYPRGGPTSREHIDWLAAELAAIDGPIELVGPRLERRPCGRLGHRTASTRSLLVCGSTKNCAAPRQRVARHRPGVANAWCGRRDRG